MENQQKIGLEKGKTHLTCVVVKITTSEINRRLLEISVLVGCISLSDCLSKVLDLFSIFCFNILHLIM